MILDDLPAPAVDGSFPNHNEIRGRVAISPRARVSNSTLCGPGHYRPRCHRRGLVRRPVYSYRPRRDKPGPSLQHHGFPFAEVRFPGLRIEASIIGERASVSRSFGYRRVHLRLDARIASDLELVGPLSHNRLAAAA